MLAFTTKCVIVPFLLSLASSLSCISYHFRTCHVFSISAGFFFSPFPISSSPLDNALFSWTTLTVCFLTHQFLTHQCLSSLIIIRRFIGAQFEERGAGQRVRRRWRRVGEKQGRVTRPISHARKTACRSHLFFASLFLVRVRGEVSHMQCSTAQPGWRALGACTQ